MEVRDAFPDVPFMSAWLFEESSASPTAPADFCLQHVRDSDLVILLVGSDTTEAVRAEVHEALLVGKPLLAFLLPSEQRTDEARALIEEVQREVTWKRASFKSSFRRELNKAIQDLLIEGVRSKDGKEQVPIQRSRLEGLGRASRVRCVSRWLAAGVPLQMAREMVTDTSVGEWPGVFASAARQPLAILVGELGAGKSLCAERLLQRAIARAAATHNSPAPAFVGAGDLDRSLEDWALAACDGLGDPGKRGIYLVLDGLDEVGGARAHRLLVDARELAAKWRGSTVILTSRPIPAVIDAPECVPIPELTSEGVLDLLRRVRGSEVTSTLVHGLPAQLQASLRRPLFAILLGVWLAQHDGIPASRGQLLVFVAESAVAMRGAPTQKLEQALRRLAVLLLERGEQDVPKAEIATGQLLESLLDTGLVVEQTGRVSFPLALLMHWFASESLKSGFPEPTSILRNREALERWREPLIILLGTGGFDQATHYLEGLVREVPGFAAGIVTKSISRWGRADDPAIGEPLECGRRIRLAYSCWKEGLQPFGVRVTPTAADGRLLPLALRTADDHRHFTAAWYSGPADRRDVSFLSPDEDVFRHSSDWVGAFTNQGRSESAWPWRLALEGITFEIDFLIGRHDLAVPDGPLVEEAVWYMACRMLERNPLRGAPIALESIPRLTSSRDDALLGSRLAPWLMVRQFRNAVQALQEDGCQELLPPWPVPDFPFAGRRSDWIWNLYSPERTRDRLNVVFRKALVAYLQMVQRWFPRVRQHMATAVTCPARVEGQFCPSSGSRELHDCPRGFWYLQPVDEAEEIQSDIQLVEGKLSWSRDADQKIYERLQRYRPHAAEWIPFVRHSIGSDLLHEYPVTRLAYQLIRQDLGWLNLADSHSPD